MLSLIPNTYHFVFGLKPQDTPFSLMHYLCLASCLEVQKPEALYVHLHHEPWGPWWDLIRPHISVRHISVSEFDTMLPPSPPELQKYRYAHLSDVLRLRILRDEGGIYADMDTLFLRPLPDVLRFHPFVMGHERSPWPERGEGSLCNAWMASAPGSDFASRWLATIKEAFDGSWSNHSTALPWQLARSHPDEIHVEPETTFFSLDWTRSGIENLFQREVELPENAVSLHLWHHLWASPSRKDFTHFHEGCVTEAYILHARTTYARWARPHLPTRPTLWTWIRYQGQRLQEALRFPRGTLRFFLRSAFRR